MIKTEFIDGFEEINIQVENKVVKFISLQISDRNVRGYYLEYNYIDFKTGEKATGTVLCGLEVSKHEGYCNLNSEILIKVKNVLRIRLRPEGKPLLSPVILTYDVSDET
jgi:hypothetical protein